MQVGFFVRPKSWDFHENLNFLESRRDASRKLLGWLARDLARLRVAGHELERVERVEKISPMSKCFKVGGDISWYAFTLSLHCGIQVQPGGVDSAGFCAHELKTALRREIFRGRVYESSRAVNKGWRFTARTKSNLACWNLTGMVCVTTFRYRLPPNPRWPFASQISARIVAWKTEELRSAIDAFDMATTHPAGLNWIQHD